ncbi:disulfide bond formation protein B [Spiribacter insolitus]|uniref:Disulfide bond formation protein B n=1 Tax=Spiribacter insolitus TaxID=3122417 RepID=A0ABV3T7E5_9GAMM
MTDSLAKTLNALGLLAITTVLTFAFADQLVKDDLPCPLCLLQRAGFALAGFGLALNLFQGQRARHFALVILGAATGFMVSVRQIFLHIAPTSPYGSGYGDTFMGLHFYTWAALLFGVIIIGSALMMIFDNGYKADGTDRARNTVRPTGLALFAFGAFSLLVIANAGSTLLECELGLCADNPTAYEMLENS